MNENQDGMNPEDFSEFLREFLSKQNGIDAEALVAAGITEDMVRLSVGLEDAGDLIGDLKQALDHV